MNKVIFVLLEVAFLLFAIQYFYPDVYSSFTGAPDPKEVLGKKRENVVFIVIDTLRADALPVYGGDVVKAPFISKLAEDAYVFDKVVSASSWTAPSVASMFTSSYPSQHGVLTGFVVTRRIRDSNKNFEFNKIPQKLVTLPEVFESNGYYTIGVSDNRNIGHEFGFDRGFKKLITLPYDGAPEVNEKVTSLLADWDKETPLFLYIQYMDPHAPYHAREPWFKKVAGQTKKGTAKKRYLSEVDYLDSHMDLLFKEHPELQDSIVIITADHGEQFWEYGERGHGKTLHKEEVHVPLIIHHPGIGKQIRIPEPVSTIDILPTLAELKGFPRDKYWVGNSLIPLMSEDREERTAYAELLYPEEAMKGREQFRSLITPYVQLIERLHGDRSKIKVYNWELTQRKIRNGTPEDYTQIEIFAETLHKAEREKGSIEFTDDDIERLKTLGYVN